jgi:hypothetical protein
MNAPGATRQRVRPLPVPTTFGGVAAIAMGPGGWLAAWQLAMALTTAIVVAAALAHTWGRALQHAALALPDEAEIRDGQLSWREADPRILHQGSYLSVVVDSAGRRETALSADVTLSLEGRQLALKSIFGWLELAYPPDLRLPLGRREITGLQSAWLGPGLAATGVLVCVALLLIWALLAVAYALVVWPLAWALGGQLAFSRAWRLAGAAQMPGALLMTAAIALYATRQLNLLGLLTALPLHFVVDWIFCAGGLRHAAVRRGPDGGNPFTEPRPAPEVRGRSTPNPFQRH